MVTRNEWIAETAKEALRSLLASADRGTPEDFAGYAVHAAQSTALMLEENNLAPWSNDPEIYRRKALRDALEAMDRAAADLLDIATQDQTVDALRDAVLKLFKKEGQS